MVHVFLRDFLLNKVDNVYRVNLPKNDLLVKHITRSTRIPSKSKKGNIILIFIGLHKVFILVIVTSDIDRQKELVFPDIKSTKIVLCVREC